MLQSQSYARVQISEKATDRHQTTTLHKISPEKQVGSPFKKAHSFTSPSKFSSPQKENSPLKKMGSLRKQSQKAAELEGSSTVGLKVFGQGPKQGPSPQKKSNSKMLHKARSEFDDPELKFFVDSPTKSPIKSASPLKKQMRLFEAPGSP